MSKKLFKQLIKRASRPIPKESSKRPQLDSYNEKQTRSHKTVNTSAKPYGKFPK